MSSSTDGAVPKEGEPGWHRYVAQVDAVIWARGQGARHPPPHACPGLSVPPDQSSSSRASSRPAASQNPRYLFQRSIPTTNVNCSRKKRPVRRYRPASPSPGTPYGPHPACPIRGPEGRSASHPRGGGAYCPREEAGRGEAAGQARCRRQRAPAVVGQGGRGASWAGQWRRTWWACLAHGGLVCYCFSRPRPRLRLRSRHTRGPRP